MTITQAFKKFGDKLKENILSIANKRSKDLNYSPTEDTDISTKGYVDTKITTPDIGSFGQVLTVDTTDENGKPLTWKLSGYNWHLIHSDDYQNIYAALNSSIATQDIEDWEKGLSLSSPSNQEINALYGFLSQVYTLVSDQQRSSLNFPLIISNLVSNGKLLLSEGVILPNKEYCLRILNVGKKNEFDPHKSIEVFVYYIESIDYWWIAKQKMSDAEYIRFKSDGTIQIDTFGYTDATLSLSNKAADAKVVGDAINELQTTLDVISAKANESAVFVVNVTENEDGSFSADKTFAKIVEAHESGKVLKANIGAYDMYAMDFESIMWDSYMFRGINTNFDSIELLIGENEIMVSTSTPLYSHMTDFYYGDDLQTTDKTIVGAINEVNDKLPTPDTTDINKVLTVNSDGTTIWSDLPQVAADEDIVELMTSTGLVVPVASNDNKIYTSNTGTIYTL